MVNWQFISYLTVQIYITGVYFTQQLQFIQLKLSVRLKMSQKSRDYLKFTVNNFQFVKKDILQDLISRYPLVATEIDVEYEHKQGQVIKLNSYQLVYSADQQSFIFVQRRKRWDCICLEMNEKQILGSLSVSFNLVRRQISKVENLLGVIQKMMKNSQDRERKQSKKRGIHTSKEDQQNSQGILLPFKSKSIKIPIKKILRQSYKMHQISLDCYLDAQVQQNSQQSTRGKQVQESCQKPIKGQNKQRDLIIDFQISYLPKLKYELSFKNMTMRTSSFSKSYKLLIIQVPKENRYVNQTQKSDPMLSQSKLQIQLQMQGWHKYQNLQSFQKSLVLPMTLNNELDQIGFLFQFDERVIAVARQQHQQYLRVEGRKNQKQNGRQEKSVKKESNTRIQDSKRKNQSLSDRKQSQKQKNIPPEPKSRQRGNQQKTVSQQSCQLSSKQTVGMSSIDTQAQKPEKVVISHRIMMEKLSKGKKDEDSWMRQQLTFIHQDKDFDFQFQVKISFEREL